MAVESEKSRFEEIVEVLSRHDVEFLVIGGQAEVLYGSPRVTYDTDLCYRRTPVNFARLARALREIKPTLRGAPPDLPFQIDARTLELGSNFTFDSRYGALGLLGCVEPFGEYENLVQRAATLPLGHVDVRVIDLDDLIKVKQHIHRLKDDESLMQLLAIRRIRDEEKPG